MAKNPLEDVAKPTVRKSVFRAAEWAKMAEERGYYDKAKLWWKADREGWDDEHYDYAAAAAYKQRIADKRAGR